MKKIMMTTVLLLTVVMGLQAQSLIGTWKMPTETDKDGSTTILFIFGQNNKLTLKVQAEVNDPEVGEMGITVNIPGTYSRKDNTLTMKFDSTNAEGKLDKMKLTKEMQAVVDGDPEMKKTFNDLIQAELTKNIKKEFAEGDSSFDGETEIIELSATKLVLDDGDEKMEFTRVK